jgi:hemerythrin-like metal-binding protein
MVRRTMRAREEDIMTKLEIMAGVSFVDIPEAGLAILCGCPENVVKFLIKRGVMRWTERRGVKFETGPNAILLSEVPVQGGRFCNLAEFPVLQMLYRQGMIVPEHPNNSGLKPMLIGLREQVEAQSRYIYLGNYGLPSREELEQAGLSSEDALDQHRMKLKFAFGAIRQTEELLDLKIIDGHALELRNGAFVRRIGINRYEFIFGGASTEVDLNLPPGERYRSPYTLPQKANGLAAIGLTAFAIVHLGEGDGWDVDRPCMGSLIIHRGEPYLIDAGPNIEESLEAVGLRARDLRGIFQTHVHDDHFVGLTALFASDRRIPFFSIPCVRRTVERKLGALCGIDERDFNRFIEVHDLDEGRWNDLEGLEVMPVLSPHPVENATFRFRVRDGDGWKSYAHLADLTSFAVLDSMVTADPSAAGMSADKVERVKRSYLDPADLKKIDAGGGMIHGDAEDFAGDLSGTILVSHTDSLSAALAAGLPVASFGDVSILARAVRGAARPAHEPAAADAVVFAALERSSLFGGQVSRERLAAMAAASTRVRYGDGEAIAEEAEPAVFILERGRAAVRFGGRAVSFLCPGDFFGEERVLVENCCLFEAMAEREAEGTLVPARVIEDCPIVLWRLREEHERRLSLVKIRFRFEWRSEYSVRCEEIDIQHRRLFTMLGDIAAAFASEGRCPDAQDRLRDLVAFAAEHFSTEERLMRSRSFPGAADHELEHAALMKEAKRRLAEAECGDDAEAEAMTDFLKGWLLKHTLLADRMYIPWLAGSAG